MPRSQTGRIFCPACLLFCCCQFYELKHICGSNKLRNTRRKAPKKRPKSPPERQEASRRPQDQAGRRQEGLRRAPSSHREAPKCRKRHLQASNGRLASVQRVSRESAISVTPSRRRLGLSWGRREASLGGWLESVWGRLVGALERLPGVWGRLGRGLEAS